MPFGPPWPGLAWLGPTIHAFLPFVEVCGEDVGDRDKPGHGELGLSGRRRCYCLLLCYLWPNRKEFAKSANSVVRARIDEQTKNEAAAVLKAMGLTVSDAFRLMMVKIAKEKALPFEPLVPNEETIEAMKAARRGELTTGSAPEKLRPSLNAER